MEKKTNRCDFGLDYLEDTLQLQCYIFLLYDCAWIFRHKMAVCIESLDAYLLAGGNVCVSAVVICELIILIPYRLVSSQTRLIFIRWLGHELTTCHDIYSIQTNLMFLFLPLNQTLACTAHITVGYMDNFSWKTFQLDTWYI